MSVSVVAEDSWKSRNIQYIRGFPFISHPRYRTENIEAALDYVAKDGDIVVTSYPKTGTHLFAYTVLQIITEGESFPKITDRQHKVMPYIEMVGTAALEALKAPRMFQGHLPFNLIKKNDKAKYMYIYRKPEDTFISAHHFYQDSFREQIPFERYFEDFLTGDFPYGSYFDHVSSWVSHKDDSNVFITTYEKLTGEERREEILRMAKFLGDEYHWRVAGDESVMSAILEHTSFEYMKKRLHYEIFDEFDAEKGIMCKPRNLKYFRKGVVGCGRQALTSDQLQLLRIVMEGKMKDSQVLDDWRK